MIHQNEERTLAGAAGRALVEIGATVALLCLVAGPALAQDAADLSAPSKWTVGETVTETESVTTTTSLASPDDASLTRPDETTSFETTIVRRCEELGGGAPTRSIVQFKAWRLTADGREDRSLEDAVVELRSDGWTLLSSPWVPSAGARAWLSGEHAAPGSSATATAADLAPPAPVAAGATWKLTSADALARLLGRTGAAGFAKGFDAGCEMKAARDGVRVELRLRPLAGDDSAGGLLAGEATLSLEGTPGAWHRSGAESADASLQITTTAKGVRTIRKVVAKRTATRKAGGELPPGKPSAWLTATGIERAARGDTEGALEAFTGAIERDGAAFAAWLGRGRVRASLKDHGAAIEDFSRAIELDPRHAEAFIARGMSYAAAGDRERAVADFTSAIKADPTLEAPYFQRGLVFVAQRDNDRALEDFKKAVGIAPGDAKAWYQLGSVRNVKGDAAGAIADLTKAVEADPKFAAAWNNRGNAKDQTGDAKGALADYVKATECEPAFVAAWFNRGRAKAALGDFEGAVEDCSKTIELNPRYAAAWNTRGNCRSEAGDEEGATADWSKAVELEPKHWQAHFSLARARFQPGLPSAPVIEMLRTALPYSRDPDYPRLWLWLARTRNGEEAAATAELKEYLASRKAATGPEWYPVLVALLTGEMLEATALGESLTADPKESAGRLCEATFFAGLRRYFQGDVANAVSLFDRSIATKVTTFVEYAEAKRWRAAALLGATTNAVRATDARPSGARPGSVRIVSPDPKGAAAIAGLQDGDIVSKINGAAPKPGQLAELLASAAPGTKLKLEVLRKSKRVVADLTLGALRK